MKRKCFLAILSRYLWPVDGGRKESLNHYFQELYDKYHYEIHLICFMEYAQMIKAEDKPYYIASVTSLKDVRFFEKAANICRYSLTKTKWPFQCSLYYSKENKKTIERYVTDLNPDVIFTEMIRTCTYIDAFVDSNALLLANLDDLLSSRYLRQAESGRSKAGFAGSYTNKLPSLLTKVLNADTFKRIILKMEAKRCQKWEVEFYKQYDYSLMTSDVERDKLNHLMNAQKAKTLSVGIDYDYYSQEIEIEKDEHGLSYLGNFSVASNADTLEMIISEVLPYLKSDYRFYIIGACPEEIKMKYKAQPRLIFCGRVDDIRKYIKKASVFLAPIAYGAGIKTKIVEAMGMAMPVVTNSVGAEGIYATSGTDYIVIDDMREIAAATDELLANPSMAKKMGQAAQAFAFEHFRWDKVLAVYQEMNL